MSDPYTPSLFFIWKSITINTRYSTILVLLTPILILEVPTKILPHVNIVDQIIINLIHSVPISIALVSIKVATYSDIFPAISDTHPVF